MITSSYKKGANSNSLESELENLNKMKSFCLNQVICRRVQILQYFNEVFDEKDCKIYRNTICNNCVSNCPPFYFKLQQLIFSLFNIKFKAGIKHSIIAQSEASFLLNENLFGLNSFFNFEPNDQTTQFRTPKTTYSRKWNRTAKEASTKKLPYFKKYK